MTLRHYDIKPKNRRDWVFGALASWCLSVFLCSCTYSEFNLATGKEETLIYNTEKEERIGASFAAQLEKNYDISSDYEITNRLKRILDRIAKVCDRQDLVYIIKIINDDQVNAVSLPGGYIYMFKGLAEKLKTDDEFAAVIAHEVGHVTARHAMKRLQASYGMMLLQVGAITAQNGALAQGVGAAYQTAFSAYSRQDEFQADKLAVRYMKRAGYDPMAIISVFKILQKAHEKEGPQQISYFRTHPYLEERMGAVRKEITGQLDFESYLDLTGQEKDLY